jgi:hypothetical protein
MTHCGECESKQKDDVLYCRRVVTGCASELTFHMVRKESLSPTP